MRWEWSPFCLRLVCRSWKDILDATPQYWAGLLGFAVDDVGWVAMRSRAGDAPLAMTTARRVSKSLQAQAFKKVSHAYILSDDGKEAWNDIMTNCGELEELLHLHLDRRWPPRGSLVLSAPNLTRLALDCPATIQTTMLRELKLFALSTGMINELWSLR